MRKQERGTKESQRGEGRPGAPPSDPQAWLMSTNVVSADFFAAAGIPLRRGRSFNAGDAVQGSRGVVVIRDTGVTACSPAFTMAGSDRSWATLLGKIFIKCCGSAKPPLLRALDS